MGRTEGAARWTVCGSLMVVFDASMALFLFSERVGVPLNRSTGDPVDQPKQRVEFCLKDLERRKVKIIIPTPALAEILVRSGAAAPAQLARISNSSAFKIVSFDERAAVQVALMAQSPDDRPRNTTETYAKLKYDRQITAIAKVEGATAIYTDDVGIKRCAEKLNIRVIGLSEMPLPPPTSPDLFASADEAKVNEAGHAQATAGATGEVRGDGAVPRVPPERGEIRGHSEEAGTGETETDA